jgi:hypothetical protein
MRPDAAPIVPAPHGRRAVRWSPEPAGGALAGQARASGDDLPHPLDDIAAALARYEFDPYGFVLWAFPWGKPGTLATEDGPEEWQRAQLIRIGDKLLSGFPVGEALAEYLGVVVEEDVSAGHGVGKSALVAWLILWAISTHPDTRGVVTANTETQLQTKTWAELGKWHNLFTARELFRFTATAIYSSDKSHERTWRIDAIPWSEKNPEAFAGLHNQGKRILVIFDEASAISDIIWETTEGALTDRATQIIWCRYGNPTKTSGEFHRRCIAAGTLVLTRDGWVPIEFVAPYAEVWDGVEWVSQDGPILNGALHTISVFGVTMTPDHKVLTTEGWVDGQACEGLERAAVRLPDGFALHRASQAGGAVGADLRVWRHEADAIGRHQARDRAAPRGLLRVQGSWAAADAWAAEAPSVPRAPGHALALQQAFAQVVQGLRWARHQGVRAVALVSGLLRGHGGLVLAGADDRAQGQQRGLLSEQLPVGDRGRAAQQHQGQRVHPDTQGALHACTNGARVRNAVRGTALAPQEPLVIGSGARHFVYDLVGCGPRSRFVVLGDDGPLIVHNCTKPRRNHYSRVDGRTVRFTNKRQIQAWIEEYGEDSDFVRVRVLGKFPRAGASNFISPELTEAARRRTVPRMNWENQPRILACDPARFGDDWTIITLRQGHKVHFQQGLLGFDGVEVGGRIAELCRQIGGVMCIVYDAVGNGADLDSTLKRIQGLPPLIPVQWGVPASDDKQYFNQRAEAWGKTREWLAHGEIPDDDELCDQLTGLDYSFDHAYRIQLESKKDAKKRGVVSPDKADSLALSMIPDLLQRNLTSVKVRPTKQRKIVWTRGRSEIVM